MRFSKEQFLSLLFPEGSTNYELCEYGVIVAQWQRAFARELHARTGDWRQGGYDWHVFTYGYATALQYAPAVSAYRMALPSGGLIFTHDQRATRVCARAKSLPPYDNLIEARSAFPSVADIYVMDENAIWTFVTTHEQNAGIGPFFARNTSR